MTVQKSHLQVTADARILLTDYRKEVQMLPIDKVVYIFFLRHPEGVTLKALSDHKEELLGLYARVLGKTKLTDKQKASVERLCDPWDNSINEKLSRIRKSFCAEVHESVADKYVIRGERGAPRIITLDEEFIETLWSDYFVDNPASGCVMEKCGFRDTGEVNWLSHLYRGDERPVKVMRLDYAL